MSTSLSKPNSTPSLSVLVPTHGRSAIILQLLDYLDAQTLSPDQFEVIVIDDGSPEPITISSKTYNYPLLLLRQEQAGPGAARNHGLHSCRAPLTLILNDDTVPASDLLERHLLAHQEAPPRCAILGTFHFTEEARRSPFVRLLDESDLLFSFTKLRDRNLYDWTYFWTCNLSLPTSVLREVGGFDSKTFPEAIVEDVELGYRLEQIGWRVQYREDCKAEHNHVLKAQSYLSRMIRLGVNIGRMWDKHRDPRVMWKETAQDVAHVFDISLNVYENFHLVIEHFLHTMAALEEDYYDKPMPAATIKQAIDILNEVNQVEFCHGLYLHRWGIDPKEVIAHGAPAGSLTSIVIVSCNALHSTKRCINALRSAHEKDYPIEIIVVDNGSTDGSAEWLAAQDDLVLVRNETNMGAPLARNQAIGLCNGSWIAFLDNDVFVPPMWLGRALYHGAVNPSVGAIPLVANRASKHQQVPYDGDDSPQEIAAAADARFSEHYRRGIDTLLFTSLAVLIRRTVIEKIGGFDPIFSPWGFEDDDIALRVKLAGWRNRVALDTFVFHAPYPDMDKHQRHSEWMRDNWIKFVKKWGTADTIPEMFDYQSIGLEFLDDISIRRLYIPLTPPKEIVPDMTPPKTDALDSQPGQEPLDSTTRIPATAKNVLILGSGRSGTSMVAGTLVEAGWNVGGDPYPARDSNPKGFFETAEVNGINEALLAASLPSYPPFGAMQRWLAAVSTPLHFESDPFIDKRIRRLISDRPFAFKDPRFCYTIPHWRTFLPEDTRYICVFREPAITAQSMINECNNADYLSGVEIDFEYALEVWTCMYRQVLDHHRNQGEWLFLRYDQLFSPAGIDRLEQFVGAPVQNQFPEQQLARTHCEHAVTEDAARLYHQLCALAGCQPHPINILPEPTYITSVASPEISVIICSYQRKDTLSRCLQSFETQTAAGRYELVVVNDGSTDGTKEMLENWQFRAPATIIHRPNGGLAAARNTALAAARGKFLLFVNDDTIAHPDLIDAHLQAHLEQSTDRAVLGTFEQPPDVLDNALMRVLEDDTLVFCYPLLQPGGLHDWNMLWTCNVSISADRVQSIQGFDEEFRHYGCEDTDLAFRLYQNGLEVLYYPQARATHEHVMSFDDLAHRNQNVSQAWVRLFRKHHAILQHPSWSRFTSHTISSLEQQLISALPHRPVIERCCRDLSQINIGVLERSGQDGSQVARTIIHTLRTYLHLLNDLWWAEGEVEALRNFGVNSIAELIDNNR